LTGSASAAAGEADDGVVCPVVGVVVVDRGRPSLRAGKGQHQTLKEDITSGR